MSGIAKGLFGGGNDSATRAAEQARALQAVANDRQLAALNADESSTASRRAPRGRRLLLSDESTSLPTTLGG